MIYPNYGRYTSIEVSPTFKNGFEYTSLNQYKDAEINYHSNVSYLVGLGGLFDASPKSYMQDVKLNFVLNPTTILQFSEGDNYTDPETNETYVNATLITTGIVKINISVFGGLSENYNLENEAETFAKLINSTPYYTFTVFKSIQETKTVTINFRMDSSVIGAYYVEIMNKSTFALNYTAFNFIGFSYYVYSTFTPMFTEEWRITLQVELSIATGLIVFAIGSILGYTISQWNKNKSLNRIQENKRSTKKIKKRTKKK
ncbi:MAG: hypothetical protein ACTSQY_05810 [Candidatus Odinarchaeia archaeon]